MTIFIIIGILFVALVVIIPLLEKSGARVSDKTTSKLGKWFMPLIGVMLVVQLVMMMFRS
ncbi:hypothetical protein [Opacimonas viscosa]|uniref:Uncharacterized protein n=1 Tax=Opacimonas viscosa TaxID=2961944 RepID=A0AA42BKD6_9ALTE|nr:hypothetical protein [Opacimonas viscosa]MCP3427658.1 hypothetical protein [Opacimonas viscosa]